MIKENFIKLYETSFKENWNYKHLTDYGTPTTYTYGQTAEEIAQLHLLFKHCKIHQGEKIALVGKNTARWCIAFFAGITYGAVVVPILQDFSPDDIHHIVNHSDSVFLFTSDSIWERLEEEQLQGLRGVFSLDDFRCLYQKDGENIQQFLKHLPDAMKKAYTNGFSRDDIKYADVDNSQLALINYTSGTTGFSKGVMLTGNNLAGNVSYGVCSKLLQRGENVISFLPLAHTFGMAFDFLTASAVGTHITLLGKVPSPKILLKAFAEIKPNLIITVPLVIEKIYKSAVLPQINKRPLNWALDIPMLNRQILLQIRRRLVEALGGRFKEVIIGGAALNPEVEEFFHRIHFPFTVGYGMTECGPLISHAFWDKFVPTSSGRLISCMEARVVKQHPSDSIGELQVHGENVMAGYYKNEEATEEAFTEDGWLRTGDLGYIDADNNIYLRGRSKTMILTSNGQNVYPEEIEAKLDNMPFVSESLVVERDKKLVALVYPDYESLDALGLNNEEDIETIMKENLANLNKMVADYERVTKIQLFPTPFEKTPKRSIKRYLYTV